MQSAELPRDEARRLRNLRDLEILDTEVEPDFDQLTLIASQICGTPISLVSLIDEDRQWFKSHHGLAARETPRDFAFCAHAILEPDELFVIPDSHKDERFAGNPLVTGDPVVRFYAGAPLVDSDGYALGTLCVIDHKPRDLTETQRSALLALANQVRSQLELRRRHIQLRQTIAELEELNDELDRFASTASHDLKSPLNSVISLVNILEEDYSQIFDDEIKKLLSLIAGRTQTLRTLVDDLLHFARNSRSTETEVDVDLNDAVSKAIELLTPKPGIRLQIDPLPVIRSARVAAQLVFQNLIGNALKHMDRKDGEIRIYIRNAEDRQIQIAVSDNGPGIDPLEHDKIFRAFYTCGKKTSGSGLGLALVRKIVEKRWDGCIRLDPEAENGTTFLIEIPKSQIVARKEQFDF